MVLMVELSKEMRRACVRYVSDYVFACYMKSAVSVGMQSCSVMMPSTACARGSLQLGWACSWVTQMHCMR